MDHYNEHDRGTSRLRSISRTRDEIEAYKASKTSINVEKEKKRSVQTRKDNLLNVDYLSPGLTLLDTRNGRRYSIVELGSDAVKLMAPDGSSVVVSISEIASEFDVG